MLFAEDELVKCVDTYVKLTPWWLGQFNWSVQIQVSWFQAVRGNVLRLATDVHDKVLFSGLQEAEQAIVGWLQGPMVCIMADENSLPTADSQGHGTTGEFDARWEQGQKPCRFPGAWSVAE